MQGFLSSVSVAHRGLADVKQYACKEQYASIIQTQTAVSDKHIFVCNSIFLPDYKMCIEIFFCILDDNVGVVILYLRNTLLCA